MYALITNDVEEFCIARGEMNYDTAIRIRDEALPKLLELYSKYEIKSTFYFLGSFTRMVPETVSMVQNEGHEIGSHAFSHMNQHAFDQLSLRDQILHLKLSRKVLESYGAVVESFRAPALRINENTVKALEETGFTSDSSISSRRIDSFFSYGTMKKLNWLISPIEPYRMSSNSPFKKGNSSVVQIPISSLGFGYIGSTMRASPMLNNLIGDYLMAESFRKNIPLVFLFHPNEILDYNHFSQVKRRSKSYFSYLIRDVLRRRIKTRNLGVNAIELLEKLIIKAKNKGFEFITVKEYLEIHKDKL